MRGERERYMYMHVPSRYIGTHTHTHTSEEKILLLWRAEGESCGLGKLDVASELKRRAVRLLQSREMQ